uniref:Uncharacterized protein n=1 Tax=Romanomermis culicivorax TaxID=13658 RepID=A0A915KBP7_ROMCU
MAGAELDDARTATPRCRREITGAETQTNVVLIQSTEKHVPSSIFGAVVWAPASSALDYFGTTSFGASPLYDNKIQYIQVRVFGCGFAYIKATAVLLIIGTILIILALFATGFGLATSRANRKYRAYRVAVYLTLVAAILKFVALIVFPVCFYSEIKEWAVPSWDFDWNQHDVEENHILH